MRSPTLRPALSAGPPRTMCSRRTPVSPPLSIVMPIHDGGPIGMTVPDVPCAATDAGATPAASASDRRTTRRIIKVYLNHKSDVALPRRNGERHEQARHHD